MVCYDEEDVRMMEDVDREKEKETQRTAPLRLLIPLVSPIND